jgi:hypothetical protein
MEGYSAYSRPAEPKNGRFGVIPAGDKKKRFLKSTYSKPVEAKKELFWE